MSDPAATNRARIAIISGANRGLGFELALGLAASGTRLVLACRDAQRGDAAARQIRQRHPQAAVTTMMLDVADQASIRRFAGQYRERHAQLDLLIHNAAAIMVPQGRTADGYETHFGSNQLGPFALTGLLLPALNAAPAARVVSLSSLAHRMTAGLDSDDPGLLRRPYKAMDAYGRSKLAALLFTFELQRRLQACGATTIAVAAHPGYAATNPDFGGLLMRLSTRLFAQPPAQAALPALHAATAAGVQGGDYYGPAGFKELRGAPRRVSCSEAARDPLAAARLWRLSEQLTGVSYLD